MAPAAPLSQGGPGTNLGHRRDRIHPEPTVQRHHRWVLRAALLRSAHCHRGPGRGVVGAAAMGEAGRVRRHDGADRVLGRRRRPHRRPPVLGGHQLAAGHRREPCRDPRDMERRARYLGRRSRRGIRRLVGGAPYAPPAPASAGRRRARHPARAGHRPLGQLLQPGALRPALQAAMGRAHHQPDPAGQHLPGQVPSTVASTGPTCPGPSNPRSCTSASGTWPPSASCC